MEEVVIRFNSEGWRARQGDAFNDTNVARLADGLGAAWSELHPQGRVLVGYDTRPNALHFAQLVAEILAAWGLEALVSDRPCPIPALSWALAHDEKACGGVMLTASGAPAEFQGIALRDERGRICSREFEEMVEALIPREAPEARAVAATTDFVSPYANALKALVDPSVITQAQLSVVVDPMYGAARGLLAEILRELGVHTQELHGELSQDFGGLHPRVVEPWVDKCEQLVLSSSADLGIVLDGDADRFGCIAATGKLISPHKTAALVLEHLIYKYTRDDTNSGVAAHNHPSLARVVMPLSGSTYIRKAAEALSCELSITPIGFRSAYPELEREDTLLGIGEYGGLSFPSHLLERDGLAAALLLVELVATHATATEPGATSASTELNAAITAAESDASAVSAATVRNTIATLEEELDARYGTFYYGTRNLKLDAGQVQTLRMLFPGLNPEQLAGKAPLYVSHTDGLRLGFDDESWVLIRPSRTDAAVRLYAEGLTPEHRDGLLDAAEKLAREQQVASVS